MDKFGKRGEYGVSSGGIWAGQHGASSGSIWRDKFGKRVESEYGEEHGVSSGGGEDLEMEGHREAPADVCGVKRGIGKREGESADAPVWGFSGFLIRKKF